MVHELIGIQDNKVDLRNVGKISKDQQVDFSFYFIIIIIFNIISMLLYKMSEIVATHAYRRLCSHQNKIPFLKLICTRILEILV